MFIVAGRERQCDAYKYARKLTKPKAAFPETVYSKMNDAGD